MRELYDLAGAEVDRRFRPHAWRWLAHKELPATTIAWCFADKDGSGPWAQGRVPVLVDNGPPIADVCAIDRDKDYLGRSAMNASRRD